MTLTIIAGIPVLIWLYLLFGRGGFWLSTERDDWPVKAPASWPSIAAVIPARNEAQSIGAAVTSLLRQNYPGDFTIVLVDDDSSDGTGRIAEDAAAAINAQARLTVTPGTPLPAGWTGKLWALEQGINTVQNRPNPPQYLLLTDADIVYEPEVLTALASHAEENQLVLTSLMVKLRCESFAERMLVPAFIFFFQLLYPFAWVNRQGRRTAAAAGGCMLARGEALRRAGGMQAIRDALIDDCALARVMKAHGAIWLGLTERVHSIRPYPEFGDIWRMVARSAYAQLQYSPFVLGCALLGMAFTYIVPPLMALAGSGTFCVLGLWSWTLMAIAFQPTLRFYRLSPLWGFALPLIAMCYMGFTLDSALQFARGQGGLWKGRVQAAKSKS